MTIVGDGRDKTWLYARAYQLDVQHAVNWRGSLPREQVLPLYGRHKAFMFPSLHDSGGTVIMEALSQALPVICLDLGGPGAMLPDECGFKIAARHKTEDQVISGLAEAMMRLASDDSLRRQLAANALAAAQSRTWEVLVRSAYTQIQAHLNM
jgi:glycosyltransferase involved in cell wall biosynthesis